MRKWNSKDWYAGHGLQILLLVAPPGQGKSTLAKYTLEIIRKESAEPPNCTALEYFYQDSHGYNTAVTATQSLLFQLLDEEADLFEAIANRHQRLLSQKSEFNVYELWEVFITALASCDIENIYVVIDGLDECEDVSQEVLWKTIEKNFVDSRAIDFSSGKRLRIFLTSRPTALARRISLLTTELEVQKSDV